MTKGTEESLYYADLSTMTLNEKSSMASGWEVNPSLVPCVVDDASCGVA